MKKPPPEPVFQLYRYQILPLSHQPLLRFDSSTPTLEQLIQQKNEFFAAAVKDPQTWDYPRAEITHRFVDESGDFLVLRMGALRTALLHTKEFTEREEEDWPSVFIAVNNNPSVQMAAIQVNKKVFQHTQTVSHILEDNINRTLKKWNLAAYFEPTFEKNDFWQIVERYPNRITRATFDLVSPNMSNISKTLTIDLSALAKSTNTQRTKLGLGGERDATLTLTPDDATINGLVEYASKGGGKISLRVKGVKKTIRTDDAIKELTVDEIVVKTEDATTFANALGNLLNE